MSTSEAADRTQVLPAYAPADYGRRRRRWPRVVLAVLAALLAVASIAAGLAYIYVWRKLDHIPRIAVSGLQPVGATDPQNILVAGSDSRANESAAAAQHFGSAKDVSGQRSDTIVLIHLDPRTSKAAMLSIPRDTFVPIAGTGSSNRINAAFDAGPGALVATITQDFHIPINHYVQEDFGGLQGLTDAVGGVCMNFAYPVRDSSPTGTGSETGLNLPAGPHVLNGTDALAFVRSRYYQYFTKGAWHPEGTGDIGRIERQHEFVRALAGQIVHSARNPFKGFRVLNRAVKTVTVDSTFKSSSMMRLAVKLRSFHPADVPSFTLPYNAVNGYGSFGDVLLPITAQDTQVIAAWQSYGAPGPEQPVTTTAPAPAPRKHTGATTPPAIPTAPPRPAWDPTAC
ncbi:MAG: LCP family protein [Acidimicrobiia bacterium]|nr:LCP family protein [Acidimicrobiia bacterium]